MLAIASATKTEHVKSHDGGSGNGTQISRIVSCQVKPRLFVLVTLLNKVFKRELQLYFSDRSLVILLDLKMKTVQKTTKAFKESPYTQSSRQFLLLCYYLC